MRRFEKDQKIFLKGPCENVSLGTAVALDGLACICSVQQFALLP